MVSDGGEESVSVPVLVQEENRKEYSPDEVSVPFEQVGRLKIMTSYKSKYET